MARPDAGLKITGLRETIKDLEALGIEAAELKVAMNKGAKILADELRKEVPKASGLLASTVKPNNAKGSAIARIGGARPKHYAPFVNYGHQSKPATLFAQKAAKNSKDRAVTAIEQELSSIIRKHNLN
jgi:HK97 gp10 family phage protein